MQLLLEVGAVKLRGCLLDNTLERVQNQVQQSGKVNLWLAQLPVQILCASTTPPIRTRHVRANHRQTVGERCRESHTLSVLRRHHNVVARRNALLASTQLLKPTLKKLWKEWRMWRATKVLRLLRRSVSAASHPSRPLLHCVSACPIM